MALFFFFFFFAKIDETPFKTIKRKPVSARTFLYGCLRLLLSLPNQLRLLLVGRSYSEAWYVIMYVGFYIYRYCISFPEVLTHNKICENSHIGQGSNAQPV